MSYLSDLNLLLERTEDLNDSMRTQQGFPPSNRKRGPVWPRALKVALDEGGASADQVDLATKLIVSICDAIICDKISQLLIWNF